MAYVIAEPCVDLKDRACVDACPVDSIYQGDRMLNIQPDECICCGACEWVCPVEAIYDEDDLPADWNVYRAVNEEFFDAVGSPGGSTRIPPTSGDHPLVAGLPIRSPASDPLQG